MGLSRKQIATLLVIGLIAGAAGAGLVAAVASFLSNSVHVQNGVTLHAPTGPAVEITETADVNLTAPFPDAKTVEIRSSAGNVTVSGDQWANVTITNINGTWTNTSSIDVIGKSLKIDPGDKSAVNVTGDITSVEWRQSMAADDGTVDFTYSSSLGSGSVTLRGLAANTKMAAVEPSSHAVLDVATSDGSGTITFSGLSSGSHNAQLMTSTGGPTLSNPSPKGKITSDPSKFSIDVNDSDFPDDSVDVEFWLDGSKIDTVTATSNGTVSTTSFGTLDLGNHTWAANATDAYGQNAVKTTSFEIPSNVTFRRETNASQIITGANVTTIFYSTDGTTVIKRSDSNDDGNISLRGLPNTEFVMVVEADQYYTRRVYLESIFNQHNIYLLNSTEYTGSNVTDTTFTYEDRTGQFPSDETTLRVQRAVDVDNDGNYSWATVAGDFWGATGEFPFTGETNARYRLVVENSGGTQRNLGTYIPTTDGVHNVVVGQLNWPIINGTVRGFDANLEPDNNRILATYTDPTNNTTKVRIRVWELGNSSNEIYDTNFSSGPYGTLNDKISLTANQSKMSWAVNYTATTNDDGVVYGQTTVGGSPFGLPVDPWLLGSIVWVGITFVACFYGPRTATLGAWMIVILVGVVMLFQWANVPTASLIAAGGIAAGGTIYKEAMP